MSLQDIWFIWLPKGFCIDELHILKFASCLNDPDCRVFCRKIYVPADILDARDWMLKLYRSYFAQKRKILPSESHWCDAKLIIYMEYQ